MLALQSILLPVPMAFIWMVLTNEVGVASFLIGYTFSFVLSLLLAQGQVVSFNLFKLPIMLTMLVLYVVVLLRDIFLSSVDVALRTIGIRPLRPGIIAVAVQQETPIEENIEDIIAGFSAHGITITPGELVVDYSPDHKVMYVHTLDIEEFGPQLDDDQERRVKYFRRILGRD